MVIEETTIEEIEVTPEEKAEEEAAFKTETPEEIKARIADELGIDAEEEADLLEKLTKRELTHRERFSKVVKQKRSWREKAKTTEPKVTPAAGETQKPKAEYLTPEEADRRFEERLEDRDLKSLNLPEEIEAEVKDLAKVKKISVRDAVKLPYIKSLIKEANEAERLEDGTPKRQRDGSYSRKSFDPSKPLDASKYDFNSKEGREKYEADKAAKAKWRRDNP